MMKILSPAGNLDSLKTAIYNGADEVYLGINAFNARNNIDSFDLSSLEQAVDFAHVYGVRVFLAINILFSDDELQSALDMVVDSRNIGVDAFIIQDLGLAVLVHTCYPDIEIHASTQMGLHNLEGAQFAHSLGFKRIVLARETPLDEIRRIKDNVDIEVEYFAQGALCVSFSGNCYMSSYLCDASGNRGKCKQLCRLPYTLCKGDKSLKTGYLLSAKDFCMIDRLADLERAGVDSLKIEGRARRPAYVGLVTREYRRALDGDKYDLDNLALAFNRQYTAGYLDGNGDIISPYPSHVGIKIGTVAKCTKGKRFNEIFIQSDRPLNEKSTFKFFDREREVATITAYDLSLVRGLYRVTTTQSVHAGCDVRLILDNAVESDVLSVKKRVNIDIHITAVAGENIRASIPSKNITVLGDILTPAQTSPLTENEIINNFNKNEYFIPNINCKINNAFLPKQKLNNFRRAVYEKLLETLVNPYKNKYEKININNIIFTNINGKKIKLNIKNNKFSDFAIINNITDKLFAKNIIFSPDIYDKNIIKKFISICREKNCTPYLDTPIFATRQDIDVLRDIVADTHICVVANNYYALGLGDYIVGGGLNVYNTVSATYLDAPLITAECDIGARIDMPYMTLRHCPIRSHLHCDCAHCQYADDYYYRMDDGTRLKLSRRKMSSCTFYLTKMR